MPYVIDDERDHPSIGRCDNCGRDGVQTRRVEAIDRFHGRSRGWYWICFDCFAPRITWRPRSDSPRVFVSPAEGEGR